MAASEPWILKSKITILLRIDFGISFHKFLHRRLRLKSRFENKSGVEYELHFNVNFEIECFNSVYI